MYGILSSSPTLLNGTPLSMIAQITRGKLAPKRIYQGGTSPNSTAHMEKGLLKHLKG